MQFDPGYFDPAFFDTASGAPPPAGPGSPEVSPFFDGCYFDSAYFDASECVVIPPAPSTGGSMSWPVSGRRRRRGNAVDAVEPALDDDEAVMLMEAF